VQSSRSLLPTFSAASYQIFDEDFSATGKLVIWSRSPCPPRVSEFFNVEFRGVLRELVVSEVRFLMGGWAAICRPQPH
jgi:hypothetical protein